MDARIDNNKYKFLNINNLEEVISTKEIELRVKSIGREISETYCDKIPIIIGVLNGAFIFMADLVRALDIKYEVDFIKIGSYGNKMKSSGNIKLIKDISSLIQGRHVIIVEDIIDSGLSITFLKEHIEKGKPESLKIVAFLYKSNVSKIDFKIDWVGYEIDNRYFVGYGLDYKQLFRGLTGIYAIN